MLRCKVGALCLQKINTGIHISQVKFTLGTLIRTLANRKFTACYLENLDHITPDNRTLCNFFRVKFTLDDHSLTHLLGLV